MRLSGIPRLLQLNALKNPLPVYCARATAAAEGPTAPACSSSRGAVPDVGAFPSRRSGQRWPPGGQEGLSQLPAAEAAKIGLGFDATNVEIIRIARPHFLQRIKPGAPGS